MTAAGPGRRRDSWVAAQSALHVCSDGFESRAGRSRPVRLSISIPAQSKTPKAGVKPYTQWKLRG